MTKCLCCVAMAAFVLGMSPALAQTQGAPLRNWTAPPTWTPPRTVTASATGMAASAQGDLSNPLPFIAVTPCRIVDTRVSTADGFHEPNFSDNQTRTFALPTSPDCTGLPSTARAWSLNVQFRPISTASYITLFPTGTTRPVVSTTVATPAGFTTDAAIVPAGTSGDIDVYCQYAGRVVIDINGYYASTLNSGEQLLITASIAGGAIRGVNSSGDGVQGQTAGGGSSGVYGNNTGGGKGVFGASTTGSGVEGQSTSGPGVRGVSSTGSGVYGKTAGVSGQAGAAGVWGDSHDYFGVWGTSVAADGVHGDTTAGGASGVAGFNDSTGAGTFGSSASGDGVFGSGLTGVHGTSQFGWGVYGHSATQDGVHGDTPSNLSSGVAGINTANGYGVYGSTNLGDGVFGQAIGTTGQPYDNGAGVHAFGTSACSGNSTFYGCDPGTYALFSEGPAKFTNAVYIDGDLAVGGNKDFVTPHPTDPTKQIAFVSLEGPESGTYFRGTGHLVGGYAEIPVPESFRLVTSEQGLTVVATASGSPASIYCVSKSLDKIVFQGSADVDFDYMVNGVRAGYENYQPIQKNYLFVPRSASDTLLSRLPAEAVRRLKANGILNDDGTINEDTARRLGWDQRPGWDRAPLAPAGATQAAPTSN
jgi:hypothetical protein